MNKSELISAIAAESGISKEVVNKVATSLVSVVTKALEGGDNVTLVGFGTFYICERAERSGRNPKTGQPITIPSGFSPKFRPGKSLKDALCK